MKEQTTIVFNDMVRVLSGLCLLDERAEFDAAVELQWGVAAELDRVPQVGHAQAIARMRRLQHFHRRGVLSAASIDPLWACDCKRLVGRPEGENSRETSRPFALYGGADSCSLCPPGSRAPLA